MRRNEKESDASFAGVIAAAATSRPPKTLGGSVLASIRHDILSLRLSPGSKLPFEVMKAKYETGLSPLREALSKLTTEGLVTSEDQRGFWVSSLTTADFIDLTTLRRDIEVAAVTRSVAAGGDAWEADLVRSFHHMVLAASDKSSGYPTEWASRHCAFHEALVSACGSPRLILLRRQLFDHFMRYQRVAPKHVWKNSMRDTEHREILDAALNRDQKKIAILIKAHIRLLDSILDGVGNGGKQSYDNE